MALRNQDFEIWAGDDKQLVFTIEDVISIAGAQQVKWAMSRSVRGEKLINKEGFAEGNKAVIELVSEDTRNIRRGRYYHELEIRDTAGKISTAAIGTVQINPTLIPEEWEGE